MDTIYLDHAAATPLDSDVLSAMLPYFSERFYNPSALYDGARAVHKDLQLARADVAGVLGCRPSEIIFTAGGTEANNLAIHGIMRRYPDANVITSSIEHDAVLSPAAYYEHRTAQVDKAGIVDVQSVAALVDDNTMLISVMLANNEIGSVQPIAKIGQLVQDVRQDRRNRGIATPLLLHTDACQAANYVDLHVARLGVDLLTLNGGKIYGPKQSGCLYVKGGLALAPLIDGGGQERSLRSGTENIAACIGFAAALVKAQVLRPSETKRLQALQKQFTRAITELPNVQINGSFSRRLANNVHVTFTGHDNERLLIQLDEAGVQAAAGSACSASSEQASHVLLAIGMSDADARASLRFTMGRGTTSQQIDSVVDILRSLVA